LSMSLAFHQCSFLLLASRTCFSGTMRTK